MMKDIVVVGGGTAGWLAALYMKKLNVEANITLVKSDKIGILGAGEGSTPHLVDFLKCIDISEYDLIRYTNATYKLGINFENWHGDGTSYFHGFAFSDDRFDDINAAANSSIIPQIVAQGKNLDDYNFSYQLARRRKTGFLPAARYSHADKTLFEQDFDYRINNIMRTDDCGARYSLHFDAIELASYFEDVARYRGVNVVEGLVHNVQLDSDEYIDYLELDNGAKINVDFLFDCTGFHRLVTGKVYNSEWISFSEQLPMKEAQPFFLPRNSDPEPWTQAIAQESGWIWKIPLQHRYGCGYVYDTDYISRDEVIDSIREQYPSAEIPDRVFKFNAGYFKTPLVKNSLAIGLAGGFVEPLEATSIFSFLEQLMVFENSNIFELLVNADARKECSNAIRLATDTVNKKCENINVDIACFIQLHYLTERQDTDFWRQYRTKSEQFEFVEARLEQLNYGDLNTLAQQNNFNPLFGKESWSVVGAGLRHIKTDRINYNDVDLENLRFNIDKNVDRFISQRDVITLCKS